MWCRIRYEIQVLVARQNDVSCAFDASCLHVAFGVVLQGADFEVAVEGPTALFRESLRYVAREIGSFVVLSETIMLEAIQIAIDAVDMVGADLQKPSGWSSVSLP